MAKSGEANPYILYRASAVGHTPLSHLILTRVDSYKGSRATPIS